MGTSDLGSPGEIVDLLWELLLRNQPSEVLVDLDRVTVSRVPRRRESGSRPEGSGRAFTSSLSLLWSTSVGLGGGGSRARRRRRSDGADDGEMNDGSTDLGVRELQVLLSGLVLLLLSVVDLCSGVEVLNAKMRRERRGRKVSFDSNDRCFFESERRDSPEGRRIVGPQIMESKDSKVLVDDGHRSTIKRRQRERKISFDARAAKKRKQKRKRTDPTTCC